jgi:alpha-ketoglutaric semialdehyde dehydrogenase
VSFHGGQRLGAGCSAEGRDTFRGVDPATGTALEGEFRDATDGEIARALELAAAAHPAFELAGRERRAALLEDIAARIEGLGDALLERTGAETALPRARLESERARTTGQLRLFAQVVRAGEFLEPRLDRGDPARRPAPKPELRSLQRALGPVVVFGASNFPLAFSTAGGDTASALAAGCPVVVKAHPNHPGAAELVGEAVAAAVAAAALPEGTFGYVQGRSRRVGAGLVRHPAARAVAFTGSFAGGKALFDLAAARPEPIPVFAEMGSQNPLFVLPARLAAAGEAIARGLAASITLGVGQFCTRPGLVFLPRGEAGQRFVEVLLAALGEVLEGTLLHAGIRDGFRRALDAQANARGVETLLRGETPTDACRARAAVLAADAAHFLREGALHEEVFGPATLIVRYDGARELHGLARSLRGQLTATLHAEPADLDAHRELVTILEQKAGRLILNGFPTGVEVSPAMVHGGPWPATTDARNTSVGTTSMRRFLRPVCYQDWPADRLPAELRILTPRA